MEAPLPLSSIQFHGHAIVSADGKIAAADGTMPTQLHNEADWQRFQTALDEAALVVLGRLGHRRHPNPGRRRLVLTSTVERLADDAVDPLALLWNPLGCSIETALAELSIRSGTVAITGGRRVFDHFLPFYAAFSLAEVHDFALHGGIDCFESGHPRRVLAAWGLRPVKIERLDGAVTLATWHRAAPD